MKIIVLILLALFLCGANGNTGTTSSVKINISVTIPPRIEKIVLNGNNVFIESNMDTNLFNIITVSETEISKTIIIIPKP